MHGIGNAMSDPIDITYQETYGRLEMQTHFHNSYEIIYILEGEACFTIGEKYYRAKENDMIFISNLESHRLNVTSHSYRRYFILIKPDYFQSVINQPVLVSIFKHRPVHFRHVISFGSDDGIEAGEIMKKMHEEAAGKGMLWEMKLAAFLQLLFISLYRCFREYFPLSQLNSSSDTVMQVQRYIEEHCTGYVSLKEVSRLFYTDMYYLSHQFKKITGFTFKEYLILQRISKARDLLFYTTQAITQVALYSGFNNVNHFIRIFKKFEGITPYQYRKKFKNEIP